jgi:hypothetical protein
VANNKGMLYIHMLFDSIYETMEREKGSEMKCEYEQRERNMEKCGVVLSQYDF